VVVEPGDDDPFEIFLDLFGGELSHGAHHGIDEEERLNDLNIENPVGSKPHEPQFRIPEGHRFAGPPSKIGKDLHVDHVDFRPQRAGHGPGHGQNFRENGNVGGLEGVTTRTEGIARPALVKQDAGLAFPYGKLGAVFDFPGPFFRDSVHQFFAGFIKPFDDLKKDHIVHSHGLHLLFFDPFIEVYPLSR
jgi:hypothetical protein